MEATWQGHTTTSDTAQGGTSINAINDELTKRPTSTGLKFRLNWQALLEGVHGAPVGLEAARKRL